MAGDFDSYVDRVLKKLKDGRPRHFYAVLQESVPELNQKEERTIFVDYLVEKGLISFDNETDAKITPHGYDVYHSDGWSKYLSHEQEKKRLEIELINSSIRTNQSSLENNKLQKILLWATAAFTCITLLVTCADYMVHRQELDLARKQLQLEPGGYRQREQHRETTSPVPDSSETVKTDSLN